jgi:hypothetical protein
MAAQFPFLEYFVPIFGPVSLQSICRPSDFTVQSKLGLNPWLLQRSHWQSGVLTTSLDLILPRAGGRAGVGGTPVLHPGGALPGEEGQHGPTHRGRGHWQVSQSPDCMDFFWNLVV